MENIQIYNSDVEHLIPVISSIFKFYPDGAVFKDINLNYLSINNVYCSFFGQDNDGFINGRSKNCFLSERILNLIKDADREVLHTLQPLNYVINSGNNTILNVTTSPIIASENLIGIISIVKDITQDEFIKENFVKKHFKHIDAEKQLQVQRETFVASIGHDLKSPTIAQIRGLELLLNGAFGKLNTEQTELLSMILDSCRYMNGMLSSLLDTYKNYNGVVELKFSEFSLAELVKECVSEMLYVAREKSVEIRNSFSYSGEIYADRVQIRRVIMNLLSNAIKYAYKETEIQLNLSKEKDNVNFKFINKSPYIPEEKQQCIFARYVSYSGEHKVAGTGLGLYASKKIIESHNGKIYVKSFKEEKNIFGFIIPIRQNNSNGKIFL